MEIALPTPTGDLVYYQVQFLGRCSGLVGPEKEDGYFSRKKSGNPIQKNQQ